MAKVSDNWPAAWGEPAASARFKVEPEHFRVTELADINFTGQGEYLYCWIEKRDFDTHSVVMDLARHAGIKPADIGYAGRKDKQAVTQQWFSLKYPGEITLDTPGFKIVKTCRHESSLKTGQHAGNRFDLLLTGVTGDREDIESRLQKIKQYGFPNYFGDQRFGRKYQNLTRGRRMLSGKLRVRERNQRSMYLSACRSFLFNEVLAERIRQDNWRQILPGDMGVGPEDYWPVSLPSYNPYSSGPQISLFGDGESLMSGKTQALENAVFGRHQELCDGIKSSRVTWSTRPAVMFVSDLSFKWHGENLNLQFSLSKGAFATALLGELFNT